MPTPVLATKLHLPTARPGAVLRPRLIKRLNEGLHRKLTLVSAAAGFGKTTLVSEWIAGCGRPVAWLSLDEGDNDPIVFLTYLVTTLQALAPSMGEGVATNLGAGALRALQSPQPPPVQSILAELLNEIARFPGKFILVLDDYHLIDARSVDDTLRFLLDHQPPQMHLVIATREDPSLPLARLRTRDQLTELRVADLRFTPVEAADFLNQMMGLNLSVENIAVLEARTEGWIAGLQLAAISMQGQDASGYIESFTGTHHFVLDYLLEEVLHRQSAGVQDFLLRTSILDRFCAPLCEAVLLDTAVAGQQTLAHLEQANLFIIPLDNERRWYRYHHLFSDLLRQRLRQSAISKTEVGGVTLNELHLRASRWYEENGYDIEAFLHAASAHDIERTTRLIKGKGIPLYARGGLLPVLKWLQSLPSATLDKTPFLWLTYARALTVAGQTSSVEQKLQAAETALQGMTLDAETRDLIGGIASNRMTLGYSQYQPDMAIAEGKRAMEYLSPDNLPVRALTAFGLGASYLQKRELAAAKEAYTEARAIGQRIGYGFVTAMATMGLGELLELDNRLHLAAETYRQALELFEETPSLIACVAHQGLAQIYYEWNDLDSAREHNEKSEHLACQYESHIDRYIFNELLLSRFLVAQGDTDGAIAVLEKTSQSVRRKNFALRAPDVAAAQVAAFLRQGNLDAAAHLATTHEIPLSLARVHLARGDVVAALSLLESLHKQAVENDWANGRTKVMALQALALHAQGDDDRAVQVLGEAFAVAEPEGFIRTFVDQGAQMAKLLALAAARGMMPAYAQKLVAVMKAEERGSNNILSRTAEMNSLLAEPLTERELKILQLIAQGHSNRDICARLFLALPTIKGINSVMFGKLQVQSRTEAIARARELGLL